MKREDIEKKAFELHAGGFHCAEAISKAITDTFGDVPATEIPMVASGFGGGMGGTHEEACGIFTGGVIAIGYIYGRMDRDEKPQKAFELTAKFRERFIEEVGHTRCGSILEMLGEQENMMKCKKLTGRIAGVLAEVIREKNT